MQQLFEHFPIGKKIRYYPENFSRIFFNTVVIAYRIDNHYLYTRDAIICGPDGAPKGLRRDDGKLVPLQSWTSFSMLVPDTTELEKTLDYFTRADLGRGGQFGRGNIITLVGTVIDKCVPLLETTVEKRQILHDGPYAETQTVLISPDLDTLVLADRRKKQRVACTIPAYLFYAKESAFCLCVMRDFSELTMCLGKDSLGENIPELGCRHSVVVQFSLGSEGKIYRIRGSVFRRGDEFCVVEIEQIDRDGRFDKIRTVDIIEIKTALLNEQA